MLLLASRRRAGAVRIVPVSLRGHKTAQVKLNHWFFFSDNGSTATSESKRSTFKVVSSPRLGHHLIAIYLCHLPVLYYNARNSGHTQVLESTLMNPSATHLQNLRQQLSSRSLAATSRHNNRYASRAQSSPPSPAPANVPRLGWATYQTPTVACTSP